MRIWARGLGAALLALGLAGCGDKDAAPAAPAAVDPAFAAAQQQWRQQRYQELHAADGWTSLVGLHWLEHKAHYIGSGAGSGIRLAVGPDKLGMVARQGEGLWFTPERGVAVSVEGAPVTGRIRFFSDRDPQPTLIAFDGGKGQLSLIHRGQRDALRVKHADAPTRANFSGLQYWPGGPSWQVRARFLPHSPGKTLPIVDITGLTTPMPNAGALEFERDGRTWRLEAIGEPGRALFVIFADRTSGHGSYPAGRYLDVAAPDATGQVLIDFNHAYNPPCAFTPFATCPLSPPENRLDLRVDAGEQAYHAPEGEA
ncbi:DUF1684 domain-containing protein [Stenotrophomonas rhizophila]|uniref:DUF1684 domain-containing protein n=1 Tax=Stenotrophomonas rhizophila TaxID=216778 RepID=UPI001E507EDC|nr:DUF1684 domain-containing protein [Stenotrophomonas rhizophila]MCC7632960.1 DUF1684 domain-containing protein [Stenotrophomonas rhizophila]MCC7662315.1 DUF1684 domain-containing protein [Stenotrophomonas rhizophila]